MLPLSSKGFRALVVGPLKKRTFFADFQRQYKTGIYLLLLKQCYYGRNTGIFHLFLRHMAQYAPPQNTITVKQ